jgi:hypothetical protein
MRTQDSDFDVEGLGTLRLATPCDVPWESMRGNAQVRRCDTCQLNVYNAREMTTAALHALLAKREGRVCLNYYVRPDGRLLTRDCPSGFAWARLFFREHSQEALRRLILDGNGLRPGLLRKAQALFGVLALTVVMLVAVTADDARRVASKAAAAALAALRPTPVVVKEPEAPKEQLFEKKQMRSYGGNIQF